MQVFLLVIHVLLAIGLIGLILIQHGRGADAGAAFGSGASATVFGSRGSASFLTRLTTFLAIGFFANSLALAYLSAKAPVETSLMDQVEIQTEPAEEPAEVAETQNADNESPAAAVEPAETGEQPADVPQVNQ